MADIQSCYFCGTGPDVPLESYGVVPSAFEPSSDEQRSVVLCPDCQNKLTALLRPVVSAAIDTEVKSQLDAGDDLVKTPSDTQRVEQPSGAETETNASQSERSDDVSTSDSGARPSDSAARPSDSAASPSDSSARSTGSGLADTGTPSRPAKRTISFTDSDTDDQPSNDSESRSTTGSDEGSGVASDDQDGSADGTSNAETSSHRAGRPDQSGDTLIGNNNDAYRKVIRLLQNRDFPVRRVEIEDLATNAYQLGPQECSGAIDTIVQKGLLVEEDGMLHRPGN